MTTSQEITREALLTPYAASTSDVAMLALMPDAGKSWYQERILASEGLLSDPATSDSDRALLIQNIDAMQSAIVKLALYRSALWFAVTVDAWRRNRTALPTLAWSLFAAVFPTPAAVSSVVVDVFPSQRNRLQTP